MITTADQLDYILVFTREGALKALEHIRSLPFWALDFETTSLSPKSGLVRLTSVSNGETSYLFDHFNCGSFEELAHLFIGPTYMAFAAHFEYKWFDWECPEKVDLWDVHLMRVAKMGGGGLSLERQAKIDLDIVMNKDMQTSDWSRPNLTDMQMNYAAFDAYVTWQLYDKWLEELTDAQWDGFHVMNDVWRGNNEMEDTALYLDTLYHSKNIKVWERKIKTAETYFRKHTPVSIIKNINSNKQMSNFLKRELPDEILENWPSTPKSGDLQLDRNTMRQAAFRLPYPMNRWIASFINYRKWNKYTSTYGDKLITIQNMSGKINTRFNVAAAITTRYSSSSQNLQNVPRKPYIRKAFCVNPLKGEKMVLADYVGIEVRVLAEIANDELLLHDTVYENFHAMGAAMINDIPYDEFVGVLEDKTNKLSGMFKGLRQTAKVFTFRLTYGAGMAALGLALKKSDEQTKDAVDKWRNRYSNAYNYRFKVADEMNSTGFITLASGNTIYVRKEDRSIPVAANYPIQGSAASVMYRAIYHTREEYIRADIDARLAATVHDELLSYADNSCAEEAMQCKIRGMTQGWLDVFPGTDTANLLDYAVGTTWADKP